MDYQKEYIEKNPDLHLEDYLDKVNEILKILPNGCHFQSMIDIGCGAGVITIELRQRLALRNVVGIDISTAMINYAKSIDHNDFIEWINDDIFCLNTKKKFDLAICNDIVEHVEKDSKFLSRVAALAKKTVIKVPLEKSFLAKFLKFFNIADVWSDTESRYGHIHHYSEKEIDRKILSSGFKIIKSDFIPMPKRSKFKWEIVRLLFLPLVMFNKKLSVLLNGGFKIYYLESNI